MKTEKTFFVQMKGIMQHGVRQNILLFLSLVVVFIVSGYFISKQVDRSIQSYQDAYLSLSAQLLQERFLQNAETHRNRLKVLAVRPEIGEGQFVIRAEGNTAPLGKLLLQERLAARADHIRAINSKGKLLFQSGTVDFDPCLILDELVASILAHPPIKDPQNQLDEVVHSRFVLADKRIHLLTVAPLLDVEDIVGVIVLVHIQQDTMLTVLRNEMRNLYFSGSNPFEISLANREQVLHSTFVNYSSFVLHPPFLQPFDQSVEGRQFRHIPVSLQGTPFYLVLSSDSADLGGLHQVIRLILTVIFITVFVLLLIIILFNVRQISLRQQAKDLSERATRFRRLADAALEGIVFSEQGRIVDVNQALTELFSCEAKELIGKSLLTLVPAHQTLALQQSLDESTSDPGEFHCRRGDGTTFVSEIRSRVIDDFGKPMMVTAIRDISVRKEVEERLRESKELAEQACLDLQQLDQQKTALNQQLNQTLEEVRDANRRIMESIRFAERIQRSLLPKMVCMQEKMPNSFFVWQPRDIVSGDLLFFYQTDQGMVIVLMDCTGHGVPGALMTMIAHSTLHRIFVNENCHDNPSEILRRLNVHIKHQMHQDDDVFFTDVGLDCGVCYVRYDSRELIFAGAHIDLYWVSSTESSIMPGNRYSIGYRRSDGSYSFRNHVIPLQHSATFYMVSDGVTDQVGGPHHIPFGKKRLLAFLDSLRNEPVSQHGEAILHSVDAFRGASDWRDDVTMVGIQTIQAG
ncbi:MAG: SpoIIE family protein phosphatase [Magnetococcus sp. YQC-5]